ncbi:MAG: HAD family phosphatase [Deltaproteobacteria bacterium]|nr:HAD family phosphatase [Deltaproteobacteria bacterium]
MPIRDEFAAVLFDVDGVLLDSMSLHVDAWVRAGQELGIEITEDEVYRREGEKAEVSARDFVKSAGMMTTRARAAALLERKREIYARIAAAPKLFPGVEAVLAAARGAGLALAFVTGTSRAEMNAILPASVAEFFDASVCGDEVMHGKPNPEPYMTAARLLKLHARECLVIENAPYGIRSGRTAGCTVWAVRSTLDGDHLREAHRVIERIEDLLPEI